MKKVAVIGGGIFGCTAAIELARKGFEVTIFEREREIFEGATRNNHLRHHYGYHYPRSKETALESIRARESFASEFKDSIIEGFPAYYAVAKEDSKSSKEEFMEFCDDLGLKYKLVEPDPNIFDISKISICLETPEPAYDPEILKRLILNKLKEEKVKLSLDSEIVGGKILDDGKKRLKIKRREKITEEEFDFIVSAIYSNFNKINEWFGMPKKKFRYDLMELLDMELPIKERFGAMIVDGDFCTFVPLIKKGVVRLGHVREVRIKTVISEEIDAEKLIRENTNSNRKRIIEESIKYFPILKKAKFLRSNFIVRIIKDNVERTDERPTEITNHGKGIFSIFGGKVITCVNTAREILKMIKNSKD